MTQPVFTLTEVDTPEELIVYTARVSNPANQMNMETAPKLLRYLIRKKHWSPFEMVDMCVEIKTSRAIAAQILRHRSFSFQEFSQRYAEVTDFEPVQLRKQGVTNRQSSEEEFDPTVPYEYDDGTHDQIVASEVVQTHLNRSEQLYKNLLEAGVAKECARMVLPLTTQTTLYMKGSIRSWIHYLQQRTHQDTQMEHREVAQGVMDIFAKHFPDIYEALYGDLNN